jgi:4-hydroxy-3-methylbut-2-enyl diphosphate reductase
MKSLIEERIIVEKGELIDGDFDANDSICRQVSNREPQMKEFSSRQDVILFVSGKKSSNGRALYEVCKSFNDRSYFIESDEDLDLNWIKEDDNVGICGATSTPRWLMEKVSDYLNQNLVFASVD